jgi:phage tail sheath protein FI
MPVAPTYPGVYIEEVPSGVRTITGVATSVTAFIGRALRGPVDEATVVNSFADFGRLFGGLWAESTMSYAVRDFFQNGGGQAVIVRVANGATTARITLETESASPTDDLFLDAASPGAWGANLSALVDYDTRDPDDATLFNLTILETVGGEVRATERFLNVSLDPSSARNLARVLAQSSTLVKVPKNPDGTWNMPTGTRPNVSPMGVPPAVSPPGPDATEATISGTGDGGDISADDIIGGAGDTFEADKLGLYALEKADIFNLLCIPPPVRGGDTAADVYAAAAAYCVKRRAMLIVDPPAAWGESPTTAAAIAGLPAIGVTGTDARNAALYFPRVVMTDPERDRQLDTFVPCGVVAGVMARTDAQRGVWKAPAGLDAALNGVQGLQANLNDQENGQLNPLGINCLRSFPVTGRVVWGARTLRGADRLADEYKYVPVRRLALFLEESLYRGTQWVVFEPNDEALWAQIRLNVGAFMHNLFRQGAFQGTSPREAYLVKCDKETTTQTDINLGIVNVLVGFAPLKPAEFVIIKIQQLAGQIAT